jgi:dolichyl-phosphate-mannose-protein mannosyltransferase
VLALLLICIPVVAQAALAVGTSEVHPSPASQLTTAILVSGTAFVAIRPVRGQWVGAALIAMALAVLVLAGAVGAAIAVGVLLLVAFGIGSAVSSAIAPQRWLRESILYALGVGLGITSYLTLALALGGLLVVPFAALALGAGAILTWRRLGPLASVIRAAARPTRARIAPLLFASGLWGLVILIEAVAPEVQYDALSYHLGLPRVWIAAARLVDVPEQIQSYYYLATEMNFTLAMLLAGQVAAKLMSLAYLGLAIGAVFALGTRLFTKPVGVVAAALFAMTPAIAWQGSTTYVDAAVTAYVTLGLLAGFEARRQGSIRLAALAGVLCGLAVASKLTAVIAVAPVVLLIVAAGRGDRRGRSAGLFALGAAVAVAPWPILRYLETGNPVFPLLNAVFQSPLWPPTNTRFALSDFGVSIDVTGLAQLPFAFTYAAQRFDDGAVGAGFGVTLLVLPVAVIVLRHHPAARWLALISLLTFVAWAATAQYARYVMPALAPLTILAAATFARLAGSADRLRRAAGSALPIVLAVASFPLLMYLYPYVPGHIPYAVALGIESRETYLRTLLPTYGALEAVARTTGAASNVLIASYRAGAADDEDRLYAPGRVMTNSSPDVQRCFELSDADAALAWLEAHNVTHILIDREGLSSVMRSSVVLQPDFLARQGTLEYSRGPIELYRLRIP